MVLGVVANGEAFYASTIGPVLIVGLMTQLDWIGANTILAIPVAIVAAASYVATKRQRPACIEQGPIAEGPDSDGASGASIFSLLRHRNVWLSTVLSVLTMVALWTVLIYGPMFWTGPGQVPTTEMSLLMTLMGLGYGLWNLVLPWLSNRLGRKPVCALAGLAGAIALGTMWLAPTATITVPQFVIFGGISSSISVFYLGLIPVESVPEKAATASCALVVGASELVGVALGPYAAGLIADSAGLPAAMGVGAACMTGTAVLSFALHETATSARVATLSA